MTTSIIVCTSPWGRLKVGNRYVWVSFHEYCGPSFYADSAMNKVYDPVDENDPVWPQFDSWLKKYRAAKEKEQRARTAGVAIPQAPSSRHSDQCKCDVCWNRYEGAYRPQRNAGVNGPDGGQKNG